MCPGLASGSLELHTQGGAGALAPHAPHVGLGSVLVPAQPPHDPWASQGTSAFGLGGQGWARQQGPVGVWEGQRHIQTKTGVGLGCCRGPAVQGKEGVKGQGCSSGAISWPSLWQLSTLNPEDGGIQAAAWAWVSGPELEKPPADLVLGGH